MLQQFHRDIKKFENNDIMSNSPLDEVEKMLIEEGRGKKGTPLSAIIAIDDSKIDIKDRSEEKVERVYFSPGEMIIFSSFDCLHRGCEYEEESFRIFIL